MLLFVLCLLQFSPVLAQNLELIRYGFHSLYPNNRKESIHSAFPFWAKEAVPNWYKQPSVSLPQNHHSAMLEAPQIQPTQQHKQLYWKLLDILPSPLWIQITASNLTDSWDTHRRERDWKKARKVSCFCGWNSAAHIPMESINVVWVGLQYFTQSPIHSFKCFQNKTSQCFTKNNYSGPTAFWSIFPLLS